MNIGIKLPDYKKIASEIKRNKIFVEEKEIDDTLSWLQKSRAKFIFENRPAKVGDFVEIEYWSSQSGEKQKDAFILGNGHFVGGFEENLKGMRPSEEKDIVVKMPQNHFLKNLAGKEINFRVRMISVQKMELAEINDQFAQNLGNFENLNALKQSIKEGIYLEKQIEESQRIKQEILKRVNQNSEIKIPPSLILLEQRKMIEDLKRSVTSSLKISFEDYLKRINSSEEKLLESFLPQAEEKIKNFLILKAIAQKENIMVTDEEVKEAVNKQIKNLDFQQIEKLDINQLKEYNKTIIEQEKVLQFLENLVI